MIYFHIPDMTCGGCARSITAAIRGLDPAAHVETDISARRVGVDSRESRSSLAAAIREAGYEASAIR